MDEDAEFEAEIEALSRAQERANLNNIRNPPSSEDMEVLITL